MNVRCWCAFGQGCRREITLEKWHVDVLLTQNELLVLIIMRWFIRWWVSSIVLISQINLNWLECQYFFFIFSILPALKLWKMSCARWHLQFSYLYFTNLWQFFWLSCIVIDINHRICNAFNLWWWFKSTEFTCKHGAPNWIVRLQILPYIAIVYLSLRLNSMLWCVNIVRECFHIAQQRIHHLYYIVMNKIISRVSFKQCDFKMAYQCECMTNGSHTSMIVLYSN